MKNKFVAKAIATFFVMGLLMACNSDQSVVTASVVSASSKTSQADASWVQSPQKHNNSGLSIRYRVDGALAVGQPVTLLLEFEGAKFSDAQVEIFTPKSLAIGALAGLQKAGDGYRTALKTHEVNARSITLTPSSEGEHFVNVQLSQNGQASAAGVMLRVGQRTAPPETTGQRVTTQAGEKLIVMPAK